MKLPQLKINIFLVAIACGLAGVFVFAEAQRFAGTLRWSILVGIATFSAPYAIKYIQGYLNQRNDELTLISSKLKLFEEKVDGRLDAIEKRVEVMAESIAGNRGGVTAIQSNYDRLQGEIYASQASAQTAARLASAALDQVNATQVRVDSVLLSPVGLIKMAKAMTLQNERLSQIEKSLRE